MKKSLLSQLKAEAIEACEFRGHEMSWEPTIKHKGGFNTAIGVCVHCLKSVVVMENPPVNGIDIGGEAVALHCMKGENNVQN